jgi:hypothetical protein
MTEHDHAVTDRQLDLLVEGELSATDYAELLRRLDRVPGAWRRCALAFLEAQALRQELCGLVPESTEHDKVSAVVAKVSHTGGASRSWFWQVLVAGWLIAFGLGMLAHREMRRVIPAGQELASGGQTQDHVRRTDEHAVPRTSPGNLEDTNVDLVPTEPLTNLTLVFNGDQDVVEREVSVPLFQDSPGNVQRYLFSGSAVPADVDRLLREAGGRVRRTQCLAPIELADGRRVVIPLERVEILPVGYASH